MFMLNKMSESESESRCYEQNCFVESKLVD